MMNLFMTIAGLVLLFLGADPLVKGSVNVANRLGLSKILIGVVVVGFGTSFPELFVSMKASLNGYPEIALGNVVGSNIANILLILGMASLITPIPCWNKIVYKDSLFMAISTLFLFGLSFYGILSNVMGILLISTLIFYLYYSYTLETKTKQRMAKDGETFHEQKIHEFENHSGLLTSVLMIVAGILMLSFGAEFLIKGASNLARHFSIPESVIGLSLVAVGTSLPELAAAISAAIKKHPDIIIGNILGSNLFNILNILGITATLNPIPMTGRIAHFDIPFNLGISLGLVIMIFVFKKLGPLTGILSLCIYGVYTVYLYASMNH